MLGDMTPRITPGFACDGKRVTDAFNYPVTPKPCDAQITLNRFYGVRHGWTLTRNGLAYCEACTPRYNPPHSCPPPPPPAPAVTETFTFTVKDGHLDVTPFDWADV